MVTVLGEKYSLERIGKEDIAVGLVVRFSGGSTLRRIIGRDGGEVILRGVRSADVFEAVTAESLCSDWCKLVPAEQAAGC